MSIGSILVGIASALVVAAFLARPFRPPGVNLERAIAAWSAQLEAGGIEPPEEKEPAADLPINYCPQCGRQVGGGDHFCAGCGAKLSGGGP